MRKVFFTILLTLIVVFGNACSQVTNPFFPTANPSDLLTIDQVTEADGSGKFILSGHSNLPKQTQLTVSAVRSLTATPETSNSDQPIFYGILDRKTAVAEDGRWQANIALWSSSSEGFYQESWQRDEVSLANEVSPNPMVDFLLTVEPKEFSRSVANSLPKGLEEQVDQLLYFTPDGEPYLRVSKALPIPLPNNIKAFTADSKPNSVSPWEGRTTLDNTNTAIEKISDTPFLEEDNLPISSEQLMK